MLKWNSMDYILSAIKSFNGIFNDFKVNCSVLYPICNCHMYRILSSEANRNQPCA